MTRFPSLSIIEPIHKSSEPQALLRPHEHLEQQERCQYRNSVKLWKTRSRKHNYRLNSALGEEVHAAIREGVYILDGLDPSLIYTQGRFRLSSHRFSCPSAIHESPVFKNNR